MPIDLRFKPSQTTASKSSTKKSTIEQSRNNSNGQKVTSNAKQQNIIGTKFNSSEDCHKIRLFNELLARKNPFADLVRVSLLLNPREFELPENYVPDIQFPGTSKRPIINTTTREGRHTSYSVRRAQELDRNNLPLILRTCYFCRKGCRKAPLIHCDYCPLVYHADCIDPPLTILPNTRWMCPNHVEPIAEEKLLSSSSFCERVKLWNHFSKPLDHELIKISFLDKVHSSSIPSPREATGITKLGCRVPKRIKAEYYKFIKSIEKYDAESGAEEPSVSGYSEGNTYSLMSAEEAHHNVETSSTNFTINNNNNNYNKSQQEFEAKIDIALKYMIESSRLLESKEYHPSNGDKKVL